MGIQIPKLGIQRFVFEPWESSIDTPPPTFLVRGVIPEAALTVVYGESTSGKTFFCLDLACTIARGIPWRGLKVKQGAVAYIAAEDATGVRTRIKAYVRHHNVNPGEMPLSILADSPNFMRGEDVAAVLAGLRSYGPVSIIFVDTWSRAIAGFDENSAKDVTIGLGYCAALHKKTGAVIVLIHHTGKDASKGARGSSALRAAADAEIEITRFEAERIAQITKLKNAEDGAEFGFRLAPVLVGQDAEGDDITSCVLEHVAAPPRAQRGAREPKGVVEKLVMRVAGDLTIGGAVSVADLIGACVDQIPYDPSVSKRDKRREHVLRAIESLCGRGVLTVEGNNVEVAE